MPRSIVFDSGPLISLAMNNMLGILEPMKSKFNGEFYITEAVKGECIDRPLESKKFKFEALQILKLIQEGTIKVISNDEIKKKAELLSDVANSLFKAHDTLIKVVHLGEIESVAAAIILKSEAVVIDEFITRGLIENPVSAKDRMEKKLHTRIFIDKGMLSKFKKEVYGLKILRSFELVTIAYEFGLFDDYKLNLPNPEKTLLEGILWAIKLNGCSVSEYEINDVLALEIN